MLLEARDLGREVATVAPGGPDGRQLPVLGPSSQGVGVDMQQRHHLGQRHQRDRTASPSREPRPFLTRRSRRFWSGLGHGAPSVNEHGGAAQGCGPPRDGRAHGVGRHGRSAGTTPRGDVGCIRGERRRERRRGHVPWAGGPTLRARLEIPMMSRGASRRSLVPMCPQTPRVTGPLGPTQLLPGRDRRFGAPLGPMCGVRAQDSRLMRSAPSSTRARRHHPWVAGREACARVRDQPRSSERVVAIAHPHRETRDPPGSRASPLSVPPRIAGRPAGQRLTEAVM